MLNDIINILDYDEASSAIAANAFNDPDWTYVAKAYDAAKHIGAQSITSAAMASNEHFVVEVADEDGIYLGTL